MSNDNQWNWIDDLFGGREKDYPITNDKGEVIGTGKVSQTSEDRQRNEGNKGDYPHTTRDGGSTWHRSEDKKTHSDSWNLNNDSRYSKDSDDASENTTSEEGGSWNLFDPSTW